MNRTRNTPKATPKRQAKVLLTAADQKALDTIVAEGWATNTTTAIRFALKIASDKVSQ